MKAKKAIEVLKKMIRLNRSAIKQLRAEYDAGCMVNREIEVQTLIAAQERELKRQMYLLTVLISNSPNERKIK